MRLPVLTRAAASKQRSVDSLQQGGELVGGQVIWDRGHAHTAGLEPFNVGRRAA